MITHFNKRYTYIILSSLTRNSLVCIRSPSILAERPVHPHDTDHDISGAVVVVVVDDDDDVMVDVEGDTDEA